MVSSWWLPGFLLAFLLALLAEGDRHFVVVRQVHWLFEALFNNAWVEVRSPLVRVDGGDTEGVKSEEVPEAPAR